MPKTAKGSLRFFYSAALRKRTDAVLARIERDDDATRHARALSAVVVELTKVGLDYYFLQPLRQAQFGFVIRQTAALGMGGVVRMMSPMIGSILGGADTRRLRCVAQHIRHLAEPSAGEERRPATR